MAVLRWGHPEPLSYFTDLGSVSRCKAFPIFILLILKPFNFDKENMLHVNYIMQPRFLGAGRSLSAFSTWLTLSLHSVNGTCERLAIHEGLTLVLARQEAPKEAHAVVIQSRRFISAGDTPQDDVRVGVWHTAGDGHHYVHGDDQLIRNLRDKWSLSVWGHKGMRSRLVMEFGLLKTTLLWSSVPFWIVNPTHQRDKTMSLCTTFMKRIHHNSTDCYVPCIVISMSVDKLRRTYLPGTKTYIPASLLSSGSLSGSLSWVS